MNRTQKTLAQAAETTVEEEFENKIESFQDIFGGSYGMDSFTEQIVEKAEVSQSIQEIQEKIQSEKKAIVKLDNLTTAKAVINIVLSTTAIVGLAAVLSALGPIFSGLVLLIGLPIEMFLTQRIIDKDKVKTFSLQKKIYQLRIEILQKQLNGKVLNTPELSNEWNPVKVEKDSEIVEYMVRVVEDSNGMENVESRELKAE